ncbi:MAG: hypothetical protein Q7T82_12955 [Armatimonadota bacterium]|nr:hypothetical protein [Armatimonadota bacterium]
MTRSNVTRLIAVAALLLILPACPMQAAEEAGRRAALTGIRVFVKLDVRTAGGKHKGYRWVSRPTFVGTHAGKEAVVELVAQGVDADGRLTEISPKWIPSDGDMVTVSPCEGRKVEMTVRRAGESSLAVDCQGFSKKLLIKASQRDNSMQVEIAQGAPTSSPGDEPAAAKQEASSSPAAAPSVIKVSFKLDPRVTRGMYMGDRWISPATYTIIQPGKQATVDAMAQLVESKDRLTKISPKWTPSDPAMVSVTPGQGHQVKITILRPGESKLKVESRGLCRELVVKASYRDGAMRVDIVRADEKGKSKQGQAS